MLTEELNALFVSEMINVAFSTALAAFPWLAGQEFEMARGIKAGPGPGISKFGRKRSPT